MIRPLLFAYIGISIFTFMLMGCAENPKGENENRVYFEINPENRNITLPIQLNDSITANLLFDTSFILDSGFCVNHPSLIPASQPKLSRIGSAWSYYGGTALEYFDDIPGVKLGNVDLEQFDRLKVGDWKRSFGQTSDGMISFPENDTTNVWEFNFEHNYVEIHSENFEIPENSFVTPLLPGYHIQLPLKITHADGGLITLNEPFFIDFGMPQDIALMHLAKELEFFNRKEDAVWTERSVPGGYHRYYEVDAVMFDSFQMDSIRIYTFDHPTGITTNYLVGLNFLKRFNLFFDMKNRKVGLEPIGNYQRVVNPHGRRFHFSTYLTPDGRWKVRKVAEYPGNYYKKAGLREEDELITVNDIPMGDIMNKGNPEIIYDTLVFDILRGSERLEIVVPINKSEVQGD